MRILTCTSELNPCPPADQVWILLAEIIDPELVGITPAIVAKVMLWGFGFVFSAFLMGYVLSVSVGLIKKV